MAGPKDPTRSEFYVYWLEAGGVPFYVGVGRSARASDRVRYIQYCMGREAAGKPVKWSVSGRVVASLLDLGLGVEVAYAEKGLVRSMAVVAERAEIVRLLAAGLTLANVHHNPQRPRSADEVVSAIRSRLGAAKASCRRRSNHGL